MNHHAKVPRVSCERLRIPVTIPKDNMRLDLLAVIEALDGKRVDYCGIPDIPEVDEEISTVFKKKTYSISGRIGTPVRV